MQRITDCGQLATVFLRDYACPPRAIAVSCCSSQLRLTSRDTNVCSLIDRMAAP